MTDITVSLEDLEIMLVGAGAIKQIERKRDPFTPPERKFKDAMERLLREARSARRTTAPTATAWDGELDADEIKCLRMFDSQIKDNPYTGVTPKQRLDNPAIDRLLARGCIVMGQPVIGVVWSGADQAELKPDPSYFAVKITDRGYKKLEALSQ